MMAAVSKDTRDMDPWILRYALQNLLEEMLLWHTGVLTCLALCLYCASARPRLRVSPEHEHTHQPR